MGAGIAQVALQAGLQVTLVDVSKEGLAKGESRIKAGLAKLQEKGILDEAKRKAAEGALRTATNVADAKDVDFAIEAVTENEELKKRIFADLDAVVRPGGILATNTSSIPITRIAAATKRPENVIGMHFMNPVPVMKLVEVVRGQETSEDTTAKVVACSEALDKVPVAANDYPGFVANRVLMPMINEAVFCVMEGVARPDAIDTVMKLGTNQPMGPLQLADFIGLDTCLYIAEVLHKGLGDSKYRPCPLLRQYVDAGWYGKKSGRGFYKY